MIQLWTVRRVCVVMPSPSLWCTTCAPLPPPHPLTHTCALMPTSLHTHSPTHTPHLHPHAGPCQLDIVLLSERVAGPPAQQYPGNALRNQALARARSKLVLQVLRAAFVFPRVWRGGVGWGGVRAWLPGLCAEAGGERERRGRGGGANPPMHWMSREHMSHQLCLLPPRPLPPPPLRHTRTHAH